MILIWIWERWIDGWLACEDGGCGWGKIGTWLASVIWKETEMGGWEREGCLGFLFFCF